MPLTRAWMISPSYSGTTLLSNPRAAGRACTSRTKSPIRFPAGAGMPSSCRTPSEKLMRSDPVFSTTSRAVPEGEASRAEMVREPETGRRSGCGACSTTCTLLRSVERVLNTDRVRAPVSGSNPSSDAPSLV